MARVVKLSNSHIRFRCPACGAAKRAPASYAGRRVQCPECKSAVRLPIPRSQRLNVMKDSRADV